MPVLGIVSDTHVPDRLAELPAALLEAFRENQVAAILHAGDICRPRVLAALEEVAPVTAVLGNRDLLWPPNWALQRKVTQDIDGVRVGLIHGADRPGRYLLKRLLRRHTAISPSTLSTHFPEDTRVIVYGHTHVPNIEWHNGTLLFNPGTVTPDWHTQDGPTAGLLEITNGELRPSLIRLAPGSTKS